MLYLAWFGALVMQLILFMGVVWWQVRFWAWLELRSWWWGRWNCLWCLGRLASFLDWQRSWRCWGRENFVILLVLVFLICLWLLPGGYLTVLSGFFFLLFAFFEQLGWTPSSWGWDQSLGLSIGHLSKVGLNSLLFYLLQVGPEPRYCFSGCCCCWTSWLTCGLTLRSVHGL